MCLASQQSLPLSLHTSHPLSSACQIIYPRPAESINTYIESLEILKIESKGQDHRAISKSSLNYTIAVLARAQPYREGETQNHHGVPESTAPNHDLAMESMDFGGISVGFCWDFAGFSHGFQSFQHGFQHYESFQLKTHATRPLPDNWRPRNAQI